MTIGNVRVRGALALFVVLAACGGAPSKGTDVGGASSAPTEGAAAGGEGAAVASKEAEPEPPVEHPFAKTAQQATTMIDQAIEARNKPLMKCVEAYRARVNDPNAKVAAKVGIDQEGNLIGVTTAKAGTLDKEVLECIHAALRRAPFPRSNAGVITVTKSFENMVVYQ